MLHNPEHVINTFAVSIGQTISGFVSKNIIGLYRVTCISAVFLLFHLKKFNINRFMVLPGLLFTSQGQVFFSSASVSAKLTVWKKSLMARKNRE